jgi:molybdopterin synthase sulfur carrier subunit
LPAESTGKMKINVKFLASIREIVGAHEIPFELNAGDSVKDLLEVLESRFGTDFKEAAGKPFEDENPRIRFLVNGRDIDFLQGPGTELKEGDLVVLIPPVGGG